MGMCFVAITATDEMLARIHADPPLIWRLYDPEDDDAYVNAITEGKKTGFSFWRSTRKEIQIPDPLPTIEYASGERLEVDLDKSWDGINFCIKKLTNNDVLNLFEEGKPVGSEGIGYGPALTFKADETKRLSDVYAVLSAADVLGQYEPEKMKDVYPKSMWSSDDSDMKEYLEDNFLLLRSFLSAAADKQLGFVVVYT